MNGEQSSLETIPYRLQLNGAASARKGKPVYTAITEPKETYNIRMLANRMVENGCLARRTTIELVLDEAFNLIAQLVAEGRAIKIPGVVRFAPSIRGAFDSPEEAFDQKKHRVMVNATIGKRMQKVARASRPMLKEELLLPQIHSVKVFDPATQVLASHFLSNEKIYVLGQALTWDMEAEDEGFFIIDGDQLRPCQRQERLEKDADILLLAPELSTPATTLLFRKRINQQLHEELYALS